MTGKRDCCFPLNQVAFTVFISKSVAKWQKRPGSKSPPSGRSPARRPLHRITGEAPRDLHFSRRLDPLPPMRGRRGKNLHISREIRPPPPTVLVGGGGVVL